MFKSFCLRVLQLVVLTLLLAQITFSSALAEETRSLNETSPPSPAIENGSEVQIPNGSQQVVDDKSTVSPKTQVRESTSSPSRSQVKRPADPYAKYYKYIKKFNEEVYGKKG
ncbi:MAG: hypothetical protein QNJ54_02025 [Prochloraceae cyanobacterium]|nr:hypothetical protein [Prochloraceae cyanobacterium]